MSFIVVGVDGSASSHAALHAAVQQAALFNVPVRAFNIVVIPATSGYEFAQINLTELENAGTQILAHAVDEVTSLYGGELPVQVESFVRTGHVGVELLRAAEEDDGATMVVSGSRGFGGFKSLLLGSVTTYLAHHVEAPLLIVPGVHQGDTE